MREPLNKNELEELIIYLEHFRRLVHEIKDIKHINKTIKMVEKVKSETE